MMINDVSVAIDRLVLIDLDVRPEEAQRLGTLIESELTMLVQREGLSSAVTAAEVSTAESVALDLSRGMGEQQLARDIAKRIVVTMRGPF